jgi:hypothetical protein
MEKFPTIRTRVFSSVTGVDNHIHVLGLECLFTDADPDESDLVALCVATEHINTSPEVHVDISWGHPSGLVEADLFKTPTEFSKSTLDAIEAGLPELYETLIAVIDKGRRRRLSGT